MKSTRLIRLPALLLASALLLALPSLTRAEATEPSAFPAADLEFFEKQVRPILAERCYGCHSHRLEEPKGGLRLDSRQGHLAGGETGPAIVPGKPEESLLVEAIHYGDLYQMPPKSKLPDEEIEVLTRWVKIGAPWPAEAPPEVVKAETAERPDPAAHWAWQPIRSPQIPDVQSPAWPRQPLDYFILNRLEQSNLKPAPPADRVTLVRRLYFDLVGLPPTPEALERFAGGNSPEPIEGLVNELLASPHYGERWARHWLDLVRYAESRGHEFDYDVPNAYEYRDYVIRAFNADLAYDKFVIEHIAGDLLETPRRHPTEGFNESILGTGFWHLGEGVHSPVDIRKDEADRFDNMIDVWSKTFLAMTVACARCHDHKFDAISQADYYAIAGFLQSSEYRQARFESLDHNRALNERLDALRAEYEPQLKTALAAAQQPVIDRLEEYLITAAHLLRDTLSDRGAAKENAPQQQARLQVTAETKQLDVEILKNWVDHLVAAAENERDPWHGFARIALAGDEPERIARVAQELLERAQTPTETPEPGHEVIDYGAIIPSDWITDGPTFGTRPRRVGELLVGSEPGRAVVGVARFASAARDPFWNDLELAPGTANDPARLGSWVRAGRSLRTPTFELRTGRLFYLVRGKGLAYAVVNSHRLINGPLHGGLLREFEAAGDEPQWIEHSLADYQGHDAHVEFVAVGDEPLEVLRVVQAPQAPAPLPRANRLVAERLVQPDVVSVESAAAHLASLWREIHQQLAANELTTEPAAELGDWLAGHRELVVIPSDAQRQLDQLSAGYQHAERDLARQAAWQSRTAPAMWDGSGRDEWLLIRGNPRTPGAPVPRRFLSRIAGTDPMSVPQGSGRLQLAEEMTSPDNPLVARVIVNRVWHHLFGRGIVPSVDNFGILGEEPTHPELLDYLARQFMREGWSLKKLVRTIVLSNTYAMSSSPDPAADQLDPLNQLWHRREIRRLEAEVIRDSMLQLSGRLETSMYGPSVSTYLTPFMQGRGRPESGPLDGAGRRSVYLAVRRNFLSPFMLAFDTPIPLTTMGRRNVSNVPAQALILMNDPFVAEQARLWARRVLREIDGSPEDRIEAMYLSAFGRQPRTPELDYALQFLEEQAKLYSLNAEQARQNEQLWADFAHVLLNGKEFIYVR